MCVDGVPENILTDAERCLAEIGHIEKLGEFSVTASFAHPDGLWARVKVKLYSITELGSIVMDTQRRTGDPLLFGLVRSYLADLLSGEKNGPFKFWRGQIIPSLPALSPSTSPGDVPALILEDDVSHVVFPDADHGDEPHPHHKRLRTH